MAIKVTIPKEDRGKKYCILLTMGNHRLHLSVGEAFELSEKLNTIASKVRDISLKKERK